MNQDKNLAQVPKVMLWYTKWLQIWHRRSLFFRACHFPSVLSHDQVKRAVSSSHISQGRKIFVLFYEAVSYVREMATSRSEKIIAFNLWLVDKLQKQLFRRVFIRGVAKLKAYADDQKWWVVYVASHRSHVDYLSIFYAIGKGGLQTPNCAAGKNLNFFPCGFFFRRNGAFFMRRSFKDNALYASVFQAYLVDLMRQGTPMGFFPEGGRSRTGQLLEPKIGFLGMLLSACEELKSAKSICLVPVHTAYDQVIEGKGYSRPKGKKGESFKGLLHAFSFLKAKHGHCVMSFGDPVILSANDLGAYCDKERLKELAQHMMFRINDLACLMPSQVVALGLFVKPMSGASLWQIATQLKRIVPNRFDESVCNRATLQDFLDDALAMAHLSKNDDGLYVMTDEGALFFRYSLLSSMNLLAWPALLAFCGSAERLDKPSAWVVTCALKGSILKAKWFISDDLGGAPNNLLERFAAEGIVAIDFAQDRLFFHHDHVLLQALSKAYALGEQQQQMATQK